MKRYLCLLSFAVISFSSCKKKYCWECSTTASNSANITKTTYCDMTEEDIVSKTGTTSSVDSSSTKPINITITTTCAKQK